MGEKFALIVVRILLFLLVTVFPAHATDYYFDASKGNDNDVICAKDAPCKALEHLNNYITLDGDENDPDGRDRVYFKRGEIWYDTIEPTITGKVTFDAYGIGALPVISGEFFYDGNWSSSSEKNGEYEYYKRIDTTNGEPEPTTVWLDGTTQLNCSSITWVNQTPNSDGVICKYTNYTEIKTVYYKVSNEPVLSNSVVMNRKLNQSGQPLACDAEVGGKVSLKDNEWCMWGDIGSLQFCAKPATSDPIDLIVMTTEKGNLDDGECFYDFENKNLYVKIAGSTPPSANMISTSHKNGMTVNDASNVTVNNLRFDKSMEYSLGFNAISDVSGIVIDGVESYYSGDYGFKFSIANNHKMTVLIQNYRIENFARSRYFSMFGPENGTHPAIYSGDMTNASGEYVNGTHNGTIRNGIITHEGLKIGDKITGYQQGTPDYRNGIMVVNAEALTVEANDISNVGNGIYIKGGVNSALDIRNNNIHNTTKESIRIISVNTDKSRNLVSNNLMVKPSQETDKEQGNSCFVDTDSGVTLSNNTCIDPFNIGFKFTGPESNGTVEKNIIQIQTTYPVGSCKNYASMIKIDGNPKLGIASLNNHIFNNNIYNDNINNVNSKFYTTVLFVDKENKYIPEENIPCRAECISEVWIGGCTFNDWTSITESIPPTSKNDDPLLNPLFHPATGSPACTSEGYIGALPCIDNDTDNDGINDGILEESDTCPYNFPARIRVRNNQEITQYYSTLQEAYNQSIPGDIIQSQAVNLGGTINLDDVNKNITLDPGKNCTFFSHMEPDGKTIINGMRVEKGSLKINTGVLSIGNFNAN